MTPQMRTATLGQEGGRSKQITSASMTDATATRTRPQPHHGRTKREQCCAELQPLVDRMSTVCCWVKTKDGPRRIDEPFNPLKLSEHAARVRAYGLGFIKPGESVTSAACLDFDNHDGALDWREMLDTADLVRTSLEMDGYVVHPFRSSGGHGIHLWLVWNRPQCAYSIREMLRAALDGCGLKEGAGGVARQQVEIYPRQDAVPADGWGNMVVLPWAGKSEPIGKFDGFMTSPAVPQLERPPKSERAATVSNAPELSRLRSALAAIPNGTEPLTYDRWFRVACAVHEATGGSDEGLALFEEFSARSSKFDADFTRDRVWRYLRDRNDGITSRTLFQLAEQHGWQDPAALDDFEVVQPAAAIQDGIPAKDAARFEFIQAGKFIQGKPLSWIIKNILPAAELGVIYGESGSGKTFFVLDMLCAIARGIEWRGHKVKPGRVAYIAAEGASGARNRVKAYASLHNIDATAIDLFILGAAPNFMLKEDIIDLVSAMRAAGPFSVVVVDTYARVMPGGNENAGEDVGRVLEHCKTIHVVTGAVVVLIHHSGKDASKGARGHSSLKAAADFEMEVVRADGDRVATVTKMKDGEDGAEFGFRLVTVPVGVDDDGDVVSSCVVEYTNAIPKSKRKVRAESKMTEMQKTVWNAICGLQGLDGAGPSANAVVVKAASDTVYDEGSGKRDNRRRDAVRVLNGFVASGRVVMTEGRVTLPAGD